MNGGTETGPTGLAALAEIPLDLLVVGGGVTGCGTALDAASRGLRVGLVEAADLGSGTSSRSSRLVHGGVRYLEQLRFGLVREALRERRLLLERIAPHLVRPVPFLYPLTGPAWERAYVGAGLVLYDTLAGSSPLPRHRHLGRAATLAQAPALAPGPLRGSIRYFDAQVDDARLTVALARTAARHGARVVPGARADAVEPAGDGLSVTVTVADTVTGERVRLRPRRVVMATGAWSGLTQERLGLNGLNVAMSKGVHLVVDQSRLECPAGVIARTPNSVLFLIPWGRHVLVGTTDTPWRADPGEVAATSRDVDYLLAQANRLLARPIGRKDVISTYAGVRPLVGAGHGGPTSTISREHVVVRQAPGVYAVAGGKLTTYRVMAADAVDTAFRGEVVAPSQTHLLPLVGAAWYAAARVSAGRLAKGSGVGEAAVRRLLHRYGDETEDLLKHCRSEPGLLQPLEGAPHRLRAEVLWAVRHEQAGSLQDVLVRRLRISTETEDRGARAAAETALLMAAELGWSEERRQAELSGYLRFVRAENRTLLADDDLEAAALMHEVIREPLHE